MKRIFYDKIEKEPILTGEEFHYVKNVLRGKIGDRFIVCDGAKNDYICEIKNINKNIELEIIEKQRNKSESDIEIVLLQGLPKSDKMELIVQKATELGVSKIIPFESRYTVAKKNKKSAAKIERWNKIAKSAAEQSGRGIVPEVMDIVKLDETIDLIEKDCAFVPYEKENKNSIKTYLKNFIVKSLFFYIGAEGGFSDEEINFLSSHGIVPVSLGKRILRTETASISVLSVINYELFL